MIKGRSDEKREVAAAIGICDASSMTLRTTTLKKSRTNTLEEKETSLRTNFNTLQTELDELIKLGNNDRRENIKKKLNGNRCMVNLIQSHYNLTQLITNGLIGSR